MRLEAFHSNLAATVARYSFLLASLLSPCLAGTWTTYGPETFYRNKNGEQRTFNVRNPATTYTLHVENGDAANKLTKAAEASIAINGVEVVSKKDFGPNVLTIDKPVSLRATNLMTLSIQAPANSAIRVSIIGVDNDAPVIAADILPLSNAAGWNKANALVTFRCSDPTSGIASCSPPVEVQTETAGQTITGTAVDLAQNSASRPVVVKVDKTPPNVTAVLIPSPNNNGWNNSNVNVSFQASDALSGVSSVTQPATLSSEGENLTVNGTATDVAGNSKMVTAAVKLDKTAPTLTISSPANNSQQTSGWVTVTGTVMDGLSGLFQTTCNGVAASVSQGQFSCDVMLTQGPNTITVAATDRAGNMTSSSLTVNYSSITVSVSPTAATLYSGQTQQFTATVANTSNGGVTWTATAGTISASGLYTAPVTIAAQQTVTVTATSQADNSKTGSATVTLSPPVTVSVSPTAATLYGGQTQQFTATVANTSNGGVTWTATAGTISAAGLYTAPATVAVQQSVMVTATSQADNTKTDSATVTLLPITVSVSPAATTLYGGQAQQFTAAVANTNNTAVTWTATAGTISASGLYTAPAMIAVQQSVTVTATSQADNTKSDSATVTLSPPITVSAAPSTAILYGGQTQQFTATVTNTGNSAVSWSATAGTISATGLFTAPATIAVQQTVTVTATSQADNATTGTASVTLLPITVSVTPLTAAIHGGQTQQFNATVTNTANIAVTWSISPPGTGMISATGLYTAPNVTQTVVVTATSQADNTKSGSATIDVTPEDVYRHRRAITILHTKVPNTDQTNFPVLISGVYNYLAYSNSGPVLHPNGFDIAFFADAAGTQRLDREIESYDPVTGGLTAWVRVPNLSHTCDTVIYMFYGNPAVTADQPNTTDTWDAGFAAVYHLSDGGALSMKDSTRNLNHCVNHGAIAGASLLGGAGGGAASFNGTSAFLDCGNAASLQLTGPLTISAWTNNNGNGRVVSKMDSGAANGYEIYIAPFLTFNLFQYTQVARAGTVGGYVGGGSIFTGNTRQLTGVYTPPSQVRSWRNGASVGGQATGTTPSNVGNSASNLSIGYNPGNGADFFGGRIDEVRISNVARSLDWVATEFNSISSPATFYSIGADNDTPPSSCAAPITALRTPTAEMSVAAPNFAGRQREVSTTTSNAGTQYNYRRRIVIDHSKVLNSDQSNFPVLISGTFSYLATTANGGNVQSTAGHDIIVSSDPDGAQKLDHELESYDPRTGAITLWVRVPVVSHSADTVLYLSYGNPAITESQENKAGVWDGNYHAVLHLGETAAPYRDSTVNAASGGTLAAPLAGTGKIGRGQTFNGRSQYIDYTGAQSPSPTTAISMETWIKTTDTSLKGILGKWESDGVGKPNQSYQLFYRGGAVAASLNSVDATDVQIAGSAAINDGAWHHVVVTADADAITVYVDGILTGRSANPHPTLNTTADRLLVGATRPAAGGYANASLDEVRISNAVRSADWIATSFNNQNSPETFFTIY